MSNEINPQLAFETIARIAATIANAEVEVAVSEKGKPLAEETSNER